MTAAPPAVSAPAPFAFPERPSAALVAAAFGAAAVFAPEDFDAADFAVEDFAVEDFAVEDFAEDDFAVEDFWVEDFAGPSLAGADLAAADFVLDDMAAPLAFPAEAAPLFVDAAFGIPLAVEALVAGLADDDFVDDDLVGGLPAAAFTVAGFFGAFDAAGFALAGVVFAAVALPFAGLSVADAFVPPFLADDFAGCAFGAAVGDEDLAAEGFAAGAFAAAGFAVDEDFEPDDLAAEGLAAVFAAEGFAGEDFAAEDLTVEGFVAGSELGTLADDVLFDDFASVALPDVVAFAAATFGPLGDAFAVAGFAGLAAGVEGAPPPAAAACALMPSVGVPFPVVFPFMGLSAFAFPVAAGAADATVPVLEPLGFDPVVIVAALVFAPALAAPVVFGVADDFVSVVALAAAARGAAPVRFAAPLPAAFATSSLSAPTNLKKRLCLPAFVVS